MLIEPLLSSLLFVYCSIFKGTHATSWFPQKVTQKLTAIPSSYNGNAFTCKPLLTKAAFDAKRRAIASNMEDMR